MWWITGLYRVVSGGEVLLQNAPRLYWLTVVFLALDVCFAISCVALACVIGIALHCCLPCIIEFLYGEVGQEEVHQKQISVCFQDIDSRSVIARRNLAQEEGKWFF